MALHASINYQDFLRAESQLNKLPLSLYMMAASSIPFLHKKIL